MLRYEGKFKTTSQRQNLATQYRTQALAATSLPNNVFGVRRRHSDAFPVVGRVSVWACDVGSLVVELLVVFAWNIIFPENVRIDDRRRTFVEDHYAETECLVESKAIHSQLIHRGFYVICGHLSQPTPLYVSHGHKRSFVLQHLLTDKSRNGKVQLQQQSTDFLFTFVVSIHLYSGSYSAHQSEALYLL